MEMKYVAVVVPGSNPVMYHGRVLVYNDGVTNRYNHGTARHLKRQALDDANNMMHLMQYACRKEI